MSGRLTKLEIEARDVRGILHGCNEDLDLLERYWPKSKRGSNAQTVFDRLRGRVKCGVAAMDEALEEAGI